MRQRRAGVVLARSVVDVVDEQVPSRRVEGYAVVPVVKETAHPRIDCPGKGVA
jgi:hypothetical protein